MAIWTEDRKKLADQKQLVASALDENMSVRVHLIDESTVDGKVVGETLEGEMASGERHQLRLGGIHQWRRLAIACAKLRGLRGDFPQVESSPPGKSASLQDPAPGRRASPSGRSCRH